ncbi:MAG: ATP-dependent helicase [Patescibacteria group bacterium UBA2103]
MHYLDGLNERQKEAVIAPTGPIAVLAGAGSGKTRVLTHRILHLLHNNVAPHEILAVTFTNKAAKEMAERVDALIKENPETSRLETRPLVTTFHSFGVRMLREFHKEAGLKKYFPIYDRADSMKVIKSIVKEMGLDEKHTEPKMILSKISKEKGDGKTPEELLSSRSSSFFLRTTAEVWDRYERQLQRESALDFDDLLNKPVQLLNKNQEVREKLQERYKHLLIDEYQDTNQVQSKLANILAAKHKSIFVVGDIDQNIYSWRGATIEHLMSFEETYPNATTIILEQNYRSTKTIVNTAQAVIEKNVNRKDKVAFTENADGDPMKLLMCSSEGDEANTIANMCRELIQEGANPGDIAVLYRTNFQSRALEEAMLFSGVPYQVLGTKFFDRKEVKDLLAYLRYTLMPDSSVDLARIINTPARGIGKVTELAVLQGKTEELKAGPRAKVDTFFNMIDRMRVDIQKLKPSDAIRYAIEMSGMKAHYEKGGEDNQERLQNLKELATVASAYDMYVGEEGILKLLEDAALMGEQDSMKDESAGVKLMTIHAAKGLEFPFVFITGMEEGLFPQQKDDVEDDEEERRLFYVALTRAHKKVYLTCARERRLYGTLYATEPSSFIGDIPEAHLVIEDGDSYAIPTIR